VNAGSGILLLALGAFVAWVRPWRRAQVAFAFFSGSLGLAYVRANMVEYGLAEPWLPLDAALEGLYFAAWCGLVFLFPRPLAWRERRLLALPATLGVAYLLRQLLLDQGPATARLASLFDTLTPLFGMFFFGLVLFALRYRAAREQPAEERRGYVLMSAALMLFPAIYSGVGAAAPRGSLEEVVLSRPFASWLILLGLGAAWWSNARRAPPGEARGPKAVALLALAAPVAGGVLGAASTAAQSDFSGFAGLARTLMVLVLAYAILRHRLLGIDLKLKWTIKQSTVTAAFVGVFFVASEGAKQFLADSMGPYVGIAAAGVLLVGLAPVQRFAERVANKALPGVEATPAYLEARKAEVYRVSLDQVLQDDGSVRPHDAELLASLRTEFAITEREHALLVQALLAARRRGPAPALQPGGRVLDRYTIEAVLGEGAHGRTFLARDEQAQRSVVIKALRERGRDPMLLREARALKSVAHPNVVRLLDVEAWGDELLLIMEHVDGGSLAERLREGGLPAAEFARVAADLLDGLGAVHGAGLLHRDVKPSNVLLTKDGRAKLADFGVAHLPGMETTKGSEPVGTVRYMSPEQARGKKVDHRSDLFSAAATLYEAYTGQPYLQPKEGESAMELQLRAAAQGPFKKPVKPATMRAWFARALAPAAEDRFGSAAEMRAASERFLAHGKPS
jgi:hypothetical protein